MYVVFVDANRFLSYKFIFILLQFNEFQPYAFRFYSYGQSLRTHEDTMIVRVRLASTARSDLPCAVNTQPAWTLTTELSRITSSMHAWDVHAKHETKPVVKTGSFIVTAHCTGTPACAARTPHGSSAGSRAGPGVTAAALAYKRWSTGLGRHWRFSSRKFDIKYGRHP